MDPLSPIQRTTLLAVAHCVVPASAGLDAAAAARFFEFVHAGLANRPPAVQRQFRAFLTILRVLPVLRYGRTVERLGPDRVDAVLHTLESAPVQIVRAGFWGLRTIVYMGYYARPEAAELVGYRPSRTGNAFLHAR